MHRALIALAFAASTLPALLAWWPGGGLLGASQLGLALTAWIALAGVASAASERTVWTSLAFALPPLALAAALDLRGGTSLAQVVPASLEGIALIVVLVIAASRASPDTRILASYDCAWLLLVIAPVCARFALDFGLGSHGAPPTLAELARWSPLGWALALCTHPGELHEHAWRPMVVVALLMCVAVWSSRPKEAHA